MSEKVKKTKATAKRKSSQIEEKETKKATKPVTGAATAKPKAKAEKAAEVSDAATPAAATKLRAVPAKAKAMQETNAATGKAREAVPSRDEIAHLAHRFWRERGGHHGGHEQDWLRAERELRGMAS